MKINSIQRVLNTNLLIFFVFSALIVVLSIFLDILFMNLIPIAFIVIITMSLVETIYLLTKQLKNEKH